MANRRSRELMFALLLICSVIALPSVAADAKRSSGVKQTSDAPCGWRLRNSGLPTAVYDVAIDPAHPDLMYAATYLGVFRSTNAGNEWTRADHLESAHTVAIDPENPSVVFAASYGIAKKTTDGGVTWTEIRPNPERLAGARALAVDPSETATVYALLVEGYGVSKSSDGGGTFSLINTGLIQAYGVDKAVALAIDPSAPSTVLLSSSNFEISKSTDGGDSWKRIGQGPPSYDYGGYDIAFAIDPSSSAVVYAATDAGLFRSSDGGHGWQRLQNGLPTHLIWDVVVDPAGSGNVYIATGEGVYKSGDRGETWTAMNEGLAPVGRVGSLAIDSSGKFLVAATSDAVFTCSPWDGITLPPALHAERLDSDPRRLPRLLEQARAPTRDASPASDDRTATNVGLLFAVAGNSPGALGTYFRSDVTLMSSDAAPQEVVAFWLAAGTDGTDAPALRLTLGPSAVTVTDFIGRMGFSGLGSLLLIAIDSGMNVDADANLTGFSRIWTAGPEGGGSVSQSLPAVGLTSLASNNAAAAIGLRMDPEYRTNVGVVNLDLKPHAFVVTVRGQRKSATFTIAVEPLSMRHVSLPAGDYGEVTAHFEMTGAEFPWAAYGASVDNATGDGWASLAVRPQNAQP